MPLRDALDAATPQPRPSRLDVVRAALPEADRRTLDEALRDSSIPAERLADALRAEGHAVAASTIKRWRAAHGAE